MLYRISFAERGLTGIASIFRSRLSGLDDLLRAGTVPLNQYCLSKHGRRNILNIVGARYRFQDPTLLMAL